MDNYKKIKQRTFQIIQKAQKGDFPSIIFDFFIITFILLNIAAIILESFTNIYLPFQSSFRRFEIISVIIFTLEYILRIWTGDLKYPSDHWLYSKLRFIISPMAIIDLLAILPFYLPMIFPFDLRVLKLLRFIRLLRVFKLNRYSSSLSLVGKILIREKDHLFVSFFMTFMLLFIASTLMYYIESSVQPDSFPNILASFWWGISTITTVGYGDVCPITPLGRALSGMIAILGIALFALPSGIISSGFIKEIHHSKPKEKEYPIYCPYCGKKIKP